MYGVLELVLDQAILLHSDHSSCQLKARYGNHFKGGHVRFTKNKRTMYSTIVVHDSEIGCCTVTIFGGI